MNRVLIGSLVLLLAAGAVLLGIVLQSHSIAGASEHSAERSFESPWVVPEGELRVTIAVEDYGAFAQVQETLPEGFSFVGSSLLEVAVKVDSRTLTFTLLGESEFTYTVKAPAVEGTYGFSGIIKDQNKTGEEIGGDSSLRVGPEPTPTPTPTTSPTAEPTPTATASPTPEPTPTPTPEPTPPPTPEPTPVATPTSTPPSTPAPTQTIAPTPEPTPAAVPTPTPTPVTPTATPATTLAPAPLPTTTPTSIPSPTPEITSAPEPAEPTPSEEAGIPAWLITLIVVLPSLAIVGVVAYVYRKLRRRSSQ